MIDSQCLAPPAQSSNAEKKNDATLMGTRVSLERRTEGRENQDVSVKSASVCNIKGVDPRQESGISRIGGGLQFDSRLSRKLGGFSG